MKSDEGMPSAVSQDWDEFFKQHASDEPTEVLVQGQPWGALEEMRLGKKLAPGLAFSLPEDINSELYMVCRILHYTILYYTIHIFLFNYFPPH